MQAMKALEQVQADLEPQLEKAKNNVKEVENQNAFAETEDKKIIKLV